MAVQRGECSAFHRVLSDEAWHHYAGAPLRLWRLSPRLEESEAIRLGPLSADDQPVAVIPGRHWQAAECLGDYALVGCTVGPGFDFADFKMLRDDSRAKARVAKLHAKLARFI